MRKLLVSVLLVAGVASLSTYESFLERFGSSKYAHLYSREAFLENLRAIQAHDNRHFTLGVN